MGKIHKMKSLHQRKISWITGFVVSCIVLLICFVQKTRITSLLDLIAVNPAAVILLSSFYILYGALCLSPLFVYYTESKVNKWPFLSSRIVEYLDVKILPISLPVLLALYFCKGNVDTFSDVLDIVLFWILLTLFALFLACCDNIIFDYDDVDLSIAQSCKTSIGALWAVGAYESFYKLTLGDIIKKIGAFETKNKIQIPVKKLFIICPLSCNVNGSFNDKDNEIFDKGQLEPLECDQGANLNRRYKHSVYGVNRSYDKPLYVVAEFASPLGTLYEKRLSMDPEKFRYLRDCMIKNLEDLLQNEPCIVLKYDDQNSSNAEPLHRFLLSSVQEQLQDRNVMVHEEKNFP